MSDHPWVPPESCPPRTTDYSIYKPGSPANKKFIFGSIPFVGPFITEKFKDPTNCAGENQAILMGMQTEVANLGLSANENFLSLWRDLNSMLSELTLASNAVGDLLVIPLQNRLMYLFASAAALALLAIAVVLSF